MKSQRFLRVDPLEDRRLLAGLDVRVFEDPLSIRSPSDSGIPAAHRVVYLDMNADGAQQASEPISISDLDGIARFRNLDPGSYLVRLLGAPRSQSQTTDTQPAPAGSWTGNLDASSLLEWDSDSIVWFAADRSLIQFDTDRGTTLGEIPVPGRIVSAVMESVGQGVALVGAPDSRLELIRFDLRQMEIERFDITADQPQGYSLNPGSESQLLSFRGRTFLRQVAVDGIQLLAIPAKEDWNSSPNLTPVLTGIAPGSQLQAMGAQGLVVTEPLTEGSRLSLLNYTGESFELIAQRDFDSLVRVSSISSPSVDSGRIAVETPRGIEVLSTSSGLPTLLVIDQAVGPSVFDTSRGVFWSLSKANTSRLIGWSIAEGHKLFDVLFADAGTSTNATRTKLSLGFRNDTLIGLRDGQLYRHSLTIARGTVAQVIEQIIQQVAIGIRSRSENNPPVLRTLPILQSTEDQPSVIETSAWTPSTTDSDGDSVQYILVRGGELGTLSWSTNSGGVYTPKPDANGQDQIVVQAYDGRGWSAPQTVSIQIQPINDAPRGLLYSGVLAIPENRPGYVLGSLMIVDPDSNEVFDYSVSDNRFEVVGTTLKVRDTSLIAYQEPGWIDLTLLARSRTNGDTIQRPERIFIVKDPTPFHNDYNPADVDGDGHITPLDPLVIINYLNSNGSGQIKPPGEGEAHIDLDVDGDGQVSPLDILIVINALNNGSGDAEGEKSPVVETMAPSELEDPLGLKKPKR